MTSRVVARCGSRASGESSGGPATWQYCKAAQNMIYQDQWRRALQVQVQPAKRQMKICLSKCPSTDEAARSALVRPLHCTFRRTEWRPLCHSLWAHGNVPRFGASSGGKGHSRSLRVLIWQEGAAITCILLHTCISIFNIVRMNTKFVSLYIC